MKRLDEIEVLKKEILERDLLIAILTTISQQIGIVERLMHQHRDRVTCPLSYNLAAGLIDQLKVQSAAAFGIAPNALQVPTENNVPYFDPTNEVSK